MKNFRSVALDGEGKKYAGTFQAESHEEALRMLHAQGFQVLTLEEIPDVAVEVEDPAVLRAKASLKKPEPESRPVEPAKAGFIAERIGGMPIWKTIGIGAAVLGGIPLLVFVLMPRPPLNSPEAAARSYFQTEIAGDYAAQYALFSNGRKVLAGTLESYTAKREAEFKRKAAKQLAALAESEGEAGAAPAEGEEEKAKPPEVIPVVASVEKISESEREAEAAASIIRGSVQEEYSVKLGLEKREWKVKDVKFLQRKELGKPKAEKEENEEAKDPAENPAPKTTSSTSGLKPVKGEELQPEKAAPEEPRAPGAVPPKANVNAAKQQALDLIQEAHERGVIDEKEYKYRKKQLGS